MKGPGGQTGRDATRVPWAPTQETLREALQHPNNAAVPLLEWLAYEANTQVKPPPKSKVKGTVCDIRPQFEERKPSLSYGNSAEGAVFRRHGADEFKGGAVQFVAECLSVSVGEAARLLIERADLTHLDRQPKTGRSAQARNPVRSPRKGGVQRSPAPAPVAPLAGLTSEELTASLRGWHRLSGEEDVPAMGELKRRGLLSAVSCGLLVAYAHQRDGHLTFEVRGPAGDVQAIKRRKLGDATPRYDYLTSGRGSPAWCTPNLAHAHGEIWIEGELSAVAVALALQNLAPHLGVQGIAGTSNSPFTAHLTPKSGPIYIYADPDEPGDNARLAWEQRAQQRGCQVTQLPADLFRIEGRSPEDITDACDVLGELGYDALVERLQVALKAPSGAKPNWEADIWPDQKLGYGIRDRRFVSLHRRTDRRGQTHVEEEVLSEFTAYITEELEISDGESEGMRELVIMGYAADGRELRQGSRRVTMEEFGTMTWPMNLWGARAILHAGQSRRERARTCIQLYSQQKGIQRRLVLTHTGWHRDGQHGAVYLTADRVIGASGAVDGFEVRLDGRLNDVRLPEPPTGADECMVARASLALEQLAPPEVHVPAMGALYRSPLGRMNTLVLLVGTTGRQKTSFLAPLMAHYGTRFTRDYLPEGWVSSANALEKGAHQAKDVLFLIDDYKPNAHQSADVAQKITRIIQGVADGAGRGTLTAERQFRHAPYPRGTVITSAEAVPQGHSNQARCVIVPVTESLLGPGQHLSAAYHAADDLAARGIYTQAMAGYIRFIAQHYDELRVGSDAHTAHVRQLGAVLQGAHGRNGPAGAELAYGWRVFLSYLVHRGVLSLDEAQQRWGRIMRTLGVVTSTQGEYHQQQDPVQRFFEVLSTLLTQHQVYLEDVQVGGPPARHAASAGWQVTKHPDANGEPVEHYQTAPNARLIGWVGEADGRQWALLLPKAVYSAVYQECRRQGSDLPGETTLWTQLRDQLHHQGLMRCDTERKDGTERPRTTKKTRVHSSENPLRLVNIVFPLHECIDLGGNSGNNGNKEGQSPSQSDKFLFPSFTLLPESGGNNGNSLT